MTASSKRKARSNKIARRAMIKPYVAELERAKVPPGVVKQASKLIAILVRRT